MKRRTSALTVSAAALLVAAPLLTACGTDSHPGAAAVVGDEKISVAQVQARVASVREAQREQPGADGLIANSADLPRQTLGLLVNQQLTEYAAEEAGVEVSRRELRQAREAEEQRVGGAEQLGQLALSGAVPLTSDQIDDVIRMNLLLGKLVEAQGEEQAFETLVGTADRVGVEINPRYGTWDAAQRSLMDPELPWLRPAGPATPDTLTG